MSRVVLRYPSDNEEQRPLVQDPVINNDEVVTAAPRDTYSCWEKLWDKLQLSPKWRCYKNLAFLCISSFLVFTSFMTFQSLDTSLNASHGLGSISFTVLYGGYILSCILLAPIITRHAGCKEAMMLCFFAQLLFALSHLFPRFYTLLPASLLLGLMLGPFWTAQGVYIVTLAKYYEEITGKDYKTVVSIFYGVFNFFMMSSQKFGNLMESLILTRHQKNVSVETLQDEKCGAAYCGNKNHSSGHVYPQPSTFYIDILVASFTGLCLVGIIVIAALVESEKRLAETERESRPDILRPGTRDPDLRSMFREVLDTFVVHSKKYMYFLVPIFFFSGLQQGFVYGDYTQAFVACELGIGHIGYVMLAYGYADAFSSLLVGYLERFTGRAALFTIATLVQAALILFMEETASWTWPPWLVYMVPAFWGIGDAVWQTTTSSMVGTEFTDSKDSAFACFRLWQAAGLATAFSYSDVLCTSTKLYILMAGMIFALWSYYLLVLVKRRRQQRIGL